MTRSTASNRHAERIHHSNRNGRRPVAFAGSSAA